ncbi:hypothetical protein [Taibaiella koreensis]|uniref:hypothetical protein n=1 Tax=Taibaiella koreensis TaxID=1268548 RepID=UPI0013C2FE25|nr:hypothetical protein [Taibaiella koreensis]
MEFLYRLFHMGYGGDLHDQLQGLDTNCEDYTGSHIYQIVGIVQLIVSLLVMLNFYYGLFNHPRFTYRRVWLVNVLTACFITGGFAYWSAVRYLPAEKHCADLHFTALDCLGFAFTAMLYTALFCFIASLLLKWKSITNKKIPF